MNKNNETRKEIIKTVIKPFLNKNNYTNKGNNFFTDLGLFKVKVSIQSQKYYKEDHAENFRIHWQLYCNELEEKFGGRFIFGGGFISNSNSWVMINSDTDILILKKWLKDELGSMLIKINQLQNIDYLIKSWKKDETNIQYAFLLKKNKPNEYIFWTEKMEKQILNIDEDLVILYKQKEKELKRKDCLDKELKLDGLYLIIQEKLRKQKSIQDLIITANNI